MSPHVESKTLLNKLTYAKGDRLQLFIRGVCFAVAIVAIWPVFLDPNSLFFIPSLSTFVAIASLIGTRTFHAMTRLGLTIGVIALVRHRFFCRWICPVGFCVDGANKLGKRLGRQSMQIPQLGRWIVWLTLGGALLGYPLLLLLDPLAIFANIPFLVQPSSRPGTLLPAMGFVAIITLSIIWPQVWCNKMCPLGAFQDLLFPARRLLQSIAAKRSKTDNKRNADLIIARRTVLSIAAGAVLAYAVKPASAKTSHSIRPPGALDESQFAGMCTRCGNCLRICPSGIVTRDIGQNGLVNLFTPILHFENDYCREDCIRCTKVCPSGALVLLSLKEKANIQIGLPRVNMNVCLLGDDRECSACKRWCPYEAIRYVFSEEQYSLVPLIDAQKCNGCGACEAVCPTKPKKAIVVLPNNMHY